MIWPWLNRLGHLEALVSGQPSAGHGEYPVSSDDRAYLSAQLVETRKARSRHLVFWTLATVTVSVIAVLIVSGVWGVGGSAQWKVFVALLLASAPTVTVGARDLRRLRCTEEDLLRKIRSMTGR